MDSIGVYTPLVQTDAIALFDTKLMGGSLVSDHK